MTNPSQDRINALINLYHSGQATKTEQACRELLQAYPQALIVINVLGATLKGQGKLQEAVQTFDKAIQLKPDYAKAYNNRGNALQELGRLNEAVESYDKAIQFMPELVDAFSNRGVVLQELGQPEKALESYRKAIQIQPDYAEAYYNQGNALHELMQLKEALDSYNRAIQLNPDYAEAYSNCGAVLLKLGQPEKALESYRKAIQLQPDNAEAFSNSGIALKELGQLEKAVESYKKAIRLNPDYSEPYNNLCELYEKQNMVPELKKVLYQAQEVLPENDPRLLYRMAQLASIEKRFKDALDLLERIAPEILPTEMRSSHSALLAKTYDKLGLFSKAFAQFVITNEIARESFDFQKVSAERFFDMVSHSSREWANVGKIQLPARQAVAIQHSLAFLVGFPRSGTTLLDTILQTHPEVVVVEEKPLIDAMLTHIGALATTDILTCLDDSQFAKLSEAYWAELYSHVKFDSSHKLIIDKMPLNMVHVALINRVFPDSKFILVLRHPYDCVLSCFMQNFILNDAMANFLTLQQSAKLYDAVMGLWVHYNNALDLEVYTLKYEDLVQDLQGTAEPLLEGLGLTWHENLQNYRQTALSRREIKTPSYNQVTQSLYKQAIGRWKNYRDQIKGIEPLLKPWAERFGYSTET